MTVLDHTQTASASLAEMSLAPPPAPGPAAGRQALRRLLRHRNLLAPLSALHAEMGDAFQLPFPGFYPVVLAGPAAARFVLVDGRADLHWRLPADPVARLLRHGLLVEDGAAHDALRTLMSPALHRRVIERQAGAFWQAADEVTRGWGDGRTVDVLAEMRRVAVLGLTRSLFDVDIAPDLERLWTPLLRTLAYIAPGPWLVWPAVPRLGYGRALRRMDAYLLQIIRLRRAAGPAGDDLLSLLVGSELSDDLIRDQLLTMLIAGHDTVTALLAWALHALAEHPGILARARDEVDAALGGAPPTVAHLPQLAYLERVIKETLRLYPPIHASNRLAARDLAFGRWRIPAGTRVLFSIYLTHRDPQQWPEPDRFEPDRFDAARHRPPAAFTYLPFGGGPRFCIGAAMAQLEAKVILARLLQQFEFRRSGRAVTMHMGATLEPHGLTMRVWRRASAGER